MAAAENEIPINVVGSSSFGRYPKISFEKTYNMFISEGWLVNYAGFKKISKVSPTGEGRGFYLSVRGGFSLAVIGGIVYKFNDTFGVEQILNLETFTGEVVMAENLNQQIAIVDGVFCYIYSYLTNNITKQTSVAFPPSYVSYHNTFFLIGSGPTATNPQLWYAYEYATDDTIQLNSTFALQTKPDIALIVSPLPGRGNNVIVVGNTVAEIWTQVGGTENYRRVQSKNIDSGVVSRHTFASNDKMCIFLAQNEKSGPHLAMTNGDDIQEISTDGISAFLESLERPDKSTALFFRQDGHLFYQITFFDPADNTTLAYDVGQNKFYHITDEKLDYHPARQLIYDNQSAYFVSLNDACVYEMSTDYIDYNYNIEKNTTGDIIPRGRIGKTLRKTDSSTFRVKNFEFTLEQGVAPNYKTDRANDVECFGVLLTEDGKPIITEDGLPMLSETGYCQLVSNRPAIDLSLSKNGAQSFGTEVRRYLNPEGKYRNRITWHNLGFANDLTWQLRFWGLQRFVVADGVVELG